MMTMYLIEALSKCLISLTMPSKSENISELNVTTLLVRWWLNQAIEQKDERKVEKHLA